MVGVGVALAFRRRWPTGTLYAILALTLVYVIRDYTGGPFFLAVFIAIATVASVMPTREALPRVAVAFVALALSGFFVDSADESGWVHLLYLSWSVVAFLAGKTRSGPPRAPHRPAGAQPTPRGDPGGRGPAPGGRGTGPHRSGPARHRGPQHRRHQPAGRDRCLRGRRPSRQGPRRPPGHSPGQPPDPRRPPLAPSHVLRDGDDSAPLAPTPGLSALPMLVDSVVEAGVPVTLVLEGDTGAVPEAVAGAAYRIVQESLTNVMRHAGPARVTVAVTRLADGLDVSVEDDGRGASAGPRADRPRAGRHAGAGPHVRRDVRRGAEAGRRLCRAGLAAGRPRARRAVCRLASGRPDQASIPHAAGAGGVSP